MPFYEYKCSNCGFELEELQKMSDEPLTTCPNCKKETLQKLIGTGGGLIFKGSGFYLTDYKKKSSSGTGKEKTTKTIDSTTGSAEKSTGLTEKTSSPKKKSENSKKEK
jgi:putative FmdB family regulatory protein